MTLSVPVISPELTGELAAIAGSFLASLNERQRNRALMSFDAAERRDWRYMPRRRPGVPLREMDEAQPSAARGQLTKQSNRFRLIRIESRLCVLGHSAFLRGKHMSSAVIPSLRYRYACRLALRPPASYGVRPSACLRRAGSIAVTIAFSWRNFGEDPEGKLAK
jgi:hypothetical protein